MVGDAGGNDQQRVALVAGGASGMGAATAKKLQADGFRLALADIDAEGLARVAGELGGEDEVHTVQTDITVVAQCEEAVRSTVERLGRLDALVNTAGILAYTRSDTVTEDVWDSMIDVNLKGTFFMCRYAIPELEKTRGCIVNVSSDQGLWGGDCFSVYGASKGGVTILSKALAVELAKRNIRVNVVCPGDTETPMNAYMSDRHSEGDPQGYLEATLKNYPQAEPRLIRPEEIAELIAFLCSSKVEPITGAAISIDFGLTAGY